MRINNWIWLQLFIFLPLFSIYAQKTSISGWVLERSTLEPIVFAAVSVEETTVGVYTNNDGYFYLDLGSWKVDKKLSLRIQYSGYIDTLITYDLNKEDISSLRILLDNDLLLPTVNVQASNQQVGYSASILHPKVEELKKVPVLFGEVDVIKALTLLPGISSGLEGTANIQIRGGNPSQTHTLLDDVSLYNAGHIGGFLSSIDPFGVKGIKVYKGGIPPKYGGRLSGVLDIDIRDGRQDKHITEVAIGTATVRIGREGPMSANGKYLVSGRFSYPSLIVNALKLGSFKKGTSGNKTIASMYDGLIKTVWDYKGAKVSALFFTSGDFGVLQERSGSSLFLDEYGWNTSASALTYEKTISNSFVLKSQFSHSRYGYNYEATERQQIDREGASTIKSFQESVLNDLSLNTNFVWYAATDISFSAGFDAVNRSFRNEAESQIDEEVVEEVLREKQGSLQYGVFGQIDFETRNGAIKAMGGMRASGVSNIKQMLAIEPRLRLSIRLPKSIFLNVGFDRNNQYVHQLTTNNAVFPSDIWIVADNSFKPSGAQQSYAGFSFHKGNTTLSCEVFVKELNNLIRLQSDRQDVFSVPENWRAMLATGGKGRVKGAEIFARHEGKRLTGQLAYTLSKSERQYDSINDGEWFPFTFDRTHDAALSIQYGLSNNWTLASVFVYQTGQAVTFPIAATADYFIFDKINNARVPDYHRMDISLSKDFLSRKGKNIFHTLTFSLYNAYNRRNPVDFRVEPTRQTAIDPQTQQVVLVNGFKVVTSILFPIVPGISYKWSFR